MWGSGRPAQTPPHVTGRVPWPTACPSPRTTQRSQRMWGVPQRTAVPIAHPQPPAGAELRRPQDSGGRREGDGARPRAEPDHPGKVSVCFPSISTCPSPPASCSYCWNPSHRQPGMKCAKVYFGSKEGKIFPQGRGLPWGGRSFLSLELINSVARLFIRLMGGR